MYLIVYAYLFFICGLFNDALSSSQLILASDETIGE
jgi:hypothetical protein